MRNRSYIKKLAVFMVAGVMMLGAAIPTCAATKLDTVTDTYWDEDDPIARWDEVEDAYQYEVYLYRDDSRTATIKTKKNSYNFKSKLTAEGEYTFRVRALAKSSSSSYKDGNWSDYSDGLYVSESYAELLKNGGKIDTANSGPGASGTSTGAEPDSSVVRSGGAWQRNELGWWYSYSDGSYLVTTWFQDPASGLWYYFNEQGYMYTGWLDWNNNWYYLSDSGAMLTGDQIISETSYYFGPSGALETK